MMQTQRGEFLWKVSTAFTLCLTYLVPDSLLQCVFAGGNPYLTFHCSSQGTVLIDLAPDDKEFQSVEEEVCIEVYFTVNAAICTGDKE